MYFVEREKAKNIIIEVLKQGFATNPDYPYIPRVMDSVEEKFPNEIQIYEAFPARSIWLPAIVVKFTGGDGLIRTLGDEIIAEGFSDMSIGGLTRSVMTSQTYSGAFTISIDIDVMALETPTRDKVCDWADMYLRWLFRDKIRKRGIEIKTIRLKGETTQQLGTSLIYGTGMAVEIYSEWQHEIKIGVEETLNGICNINLSAYLPDGTTY